MVVAVVRKGLVAYLRVSAPRQSVARQYEELEDDCLEFDLVVERIFTDEGIGASMLSTKIRSDYDLLVELVTSGEVDGKTLWLSEATRITRDIEEYGPFRGLCRKHRVKLFLSDYKREFDLDNPEDNKVVNNAILAGEHESLTMSVRIQSGMRKQIRSKRPHGRIPFGYAREYNTEGKVVAQFEHPVYGPIMTDIAKRYAAGESVHVIAADLNARGIPAPWDAAKLGKNPDHVGVSKWSAGDIARRATSRTYVGKRLYRGKQAKFRGTHEGLWPPLIDEETFSLCLLRRKANVVRQRISESGHLLTGIAVCGKCRTGYVCANVKNGRPVYECRNRGCFALPEASVDTLVMAELERALAVDGWRALAAVNNTAEVQGVHRRLEDLNRERKGWLEDLENDEVSREAFKLKEKQLRAAIAQAEKELEKLSTPTTLHVLLGGGDPLARFAAVGNETQRRIIRELLTITLYPAGRGRRHKRVDGVEILAPGLVVIELRE